MEKLQASGEAGGKRHALGTRRRRGLLEEFRDARSKGVLVMRKPKACVSDGKVDSRSARCDRRG